MPSQRYKEILSSRRNYKELNIKDDEKSYFQFLLQQIRDASQISDLQRTFKELGSQKFQNFNEFWSFFRFQINSRNQGFKTWGQKTRHILQPKSIMNRLNYIVELTIQAKKEKEKNESQGAQMNKDQSDQSKLENYLISKYDHQKGLNLYKMLMEANFSDKKSKISVKRQLKRALQDNNTARETINNQQETINNQRGTINNQQETINNQQDIINNLRGTINNQQETRNNQRGIITNQRGIIGPNQFTPIIPNQMGPRNHENSLNAKNQSTDQPEDHSNRSTNTTVSVDRSGSRQFDNSNQDSQEDILFNSFKGNQLD